MKLNNRGRAVFFIILPVIFAILFTYATRDICYVGNLPGNHLGWGSCNAMLDVVVGK